MSKKNGKSKMGRPVSIDLKRVAKIKKLYKRGNLTQRQIAVKFGVTQSTVSKLVNL